MTMSKTKTHGEYVQELKLKGIAYIPLSNYISGQTPILHICEKNHTWKVRPVDILRYSGCPECAKNKRRTTPDQYIQKLKDKGIKHLPLEDYIDSKTKIKHKCYCCNNDWLVPPSTVLKGHNCSSCSISGFDPTKKAILYYLKLINGTYKIGVTGKTTVFLRFKRDKPKIESILFERKFNNGAEAFKEEQRLLTKYKKYRINLVNYLEDGGNSEVFCKDIFEGKYK